MGNSPSSVPPQVSQAAVVPLTKEEMELQKNGFLSLANTHDTSLVNEHVANIETFASDLREAVEAIWPTRNESRYKEVHVLLLSWQDDNLGVREEIYGLQRVFVDFYHFDVEEYHIPGNKPGQKTQARIMSFLRHDSSSNLFIVYYAGHALQSRQGNEPPIWAATNKYDTPTLPSGGVQLLFEEADSDVLLLYDCCHSAHPAVTLSGHGVTEVIAACGFETEAPGTGPHSFTTALIRELAQAYQGPPFSVAILHSRILGSLKNWKRDLLKDDQGEIWRDSNGRVREECHKRRTPVHCFLTNERPHRSIFLAPLLIHHQNSTAQSSVSSSRSIDSGSTSQQTTSTSSAGTPKVESVRSPQVLLSIRLDESYFIGDNPRDNISQWREWIRNIPPGANDLKIQGVYESYSTLVLLSMPVSVWNILPDNLAYSFIGFISSDNKVPSLEQSPQTTLQTCMDKLVQTNSAASHTAAPALAKPTTHSFDNLKASFPFPGFRSPTAPAPGPSSFDDNEIKLLENLFDALPTDTLDYESHSSAPDAIEPLEESVQISTAASDPKVPPESMKDLALQPLPSSSSPHKLSSRSSTTARRASSKSKSKRDDWSEITEPEERRRIINRIAQRKFRDRTKEDKERQGREAENQAHAGQSYQIPDPSEMKDDDDLSGLPWGSLSLKHVVSKGNNSKELKDRKQQSQLQQQSGHKDLYYESETHQYFDEGYSPSEAEP